jgi:hypothetical protein
MCQGEMTEETDWRQWKPGALVERDLDGLIFKAHILSVNIEAETCDIVYVDDDNEEEDVSIIEIKLIKNGIDTDEATHCKEESSKLNDEDIRNEEEALPVSVMLCRPRTAKTDERPNIIMHQKDDVTHKSAYIINGLETNIASGNPIRGIRWLRENGNNW